MIDVAAVQARMPRTTDRGACPSSSPARATCRTTRYIVPPRKLIAAAYTMTPAPLGMSPSVLLAHGITAYPRRVRMFSVISGGSVRLTWAKNMWCATQVTAMTENEPRNARY